MKRIVCIALAIVCCLGVFHVEYALADEIPFVSDASIARKPVTLSKSGIASCNISNEYVQGTFYANYDVRYTVSGGLYTLNSCTVTYDYYTGYVRGDLLQPTVSYSDNGDGKLHITFSYQVKYEQNGITYYSPRKSATTTVSLIN